MGGFALQVATFVVSEISFEFETCSLLFKTYCILFRMLASLKSIVATCSTFLKSTRSSLVPLKLTTQNKVASGGPCIVPARLLFQVFRVDMLQVEMVLYIMS